jgi:hypothetical protein
MFAVSMATAILSPPGALPAAAEEDGAPASDALALRQLTHERFAATVADDRSFTRDVSRPTFGRMAPGASCRWPSQSRPPGPMWQWSTRRSTRGTPAPVS